MFGWGKKKEPKQEDASAFVVHQTFHCPVPGYYQITVTNVNGATTTSIYRVGGGPLSLKDQAIRNVKDELDELIKE